jgi:hypothetical protein
MLLPMLAAIHCSLVAVFVLFTRSTVGLNSGCVPIGSFVFAFVSLKSFKLIRHEEHNVRIPSAS